MLADSVGLALLVVLETLAPAERLAFVLHDMFDVPFDEIAPIVGRTPDRGAPARQPRAPARAGRGRGADADLARQREVVDAFLAASRGGDFDALLAVLDPDVVLHADRTATDAAAARVAQGAPAPALASELRGARAVADSFRGRARGARPALIDGLAGAAWAPGGTARAVFAFTFGPGATRRAGQDCRHRRHRGPGAALRAGRGARELTTGAHLENSPHTHVPAAERNHR